MSNDYCVDCGVLLSKPAKICPVCGFDNHSYLYGGVFMDETSLMDEEFLMDGIQIIDPEEYPGF